MGQGKKTSVAKSLWWRRILPGLAAVVVVGAAWLLLRPDISTREVQNIVLISIDTCRADYLSCYGFGRKTTPNIDAIANESIVFENVISPVPITLPAHGSMLTGTIPPYHGVHDNLDYRLGDSNVTLAEILKEHGFTTGAIISAFVLDSQFGINQGFDTFNDHFEEKHMAGTISERKGHEATRFALEWLDQHKNEKLFLFLHYYDPHTGYDPPEPFASIFADDLYAGEIAYTDYCIAQVIRKLKDLRLFDSSLIIITSDHGEMLGEHGEEEHGYFIYQSAIKVPLIFKLPGWRKSKSIKDVVGLIDIVPTVSSLLGIQPPPQVQGRDLSPYFRQTQLSGGDRYLYCESLYPTKYNANSLLGVVTDRWKYIQTTRPELYDLAQDRQESNNLMKQQLQHGRILLDRLRQILEQTVREDESDSKVILDEESRKRLESLGYVASSVSKDFEFDQSKDDPKDLIGFHVSNTKAGYLISQKKYVEAKDLCKKLFLQRPDFYGIYRHLGKIAFQEGDKEQAKVYMLESLKLNPEQADLHNNLSIVLAEQDNHNEAIRHLTESLRINPDQIVVHDNLAALLEKQGETEEAIVHLAESLRIKHNQPDVHIKLGNAFYRLNRLNEAVKHWTESLRFNPQKPYTVHNKLGNAFYRLNKLDEAIGHWSESLKLKPEQPRIRSNVSLVLAKKREKQ